jgi:hypothetical protein
LVGTPELAQDFEMGAWLEANLTLSRRPGSRGFPECWDNVLYDSPSLGYVVATHQRDLPPKGPTVWTYYLPMIDADPRVARQRVYALTHAEACGLAIADLSRAHPDLAEVVTRIDVWRWGHAMARPKPGFALGVARRVAQAQPDPNLHFASADLSGLPLFDEAQYQGVRAAEAVLARLGEKSSSWL